MKKKGPDPVRDVLMLELIGKRLKILDHSDPGLKGKEGVVLDETRGMFLVEIGGKEIRIPKRKGWFEMELREGESVRFRGDDIIIRPVDRTKKLERKASLLLEPNDRSDGSSEKIKRIRKGGRNGR